MVSEREPRSTKTARRGSRSSQHVWVAVACALFAALVAIGIAWVQSRTAIPPPPVVVEQTVVVAPVDPHPVAPQPAVTEAGPAPLREPRLGDHATAQGIQETPALAGSPDSSPAVPEPAPRRHKPSPWAAPAGPPRGLESDGTWLEAGQPVLLNAGPMVVVAEFHDERGEPYVTLRASTERPERLVTRVVVGGEQVDLPTARGILRLQVVTVDWQHRRVHVRLTPPPLPK